MINLFFIEEAAGREVRRFCFMGVVAFVSFRGCKWIISLPSLYIANTAGEQGYVRYKQAGEMSFSSPPSLRATSPIFCRAKHRGRVLKNVRSVF